MFSTSTSTTRFAALGALAFLLSSALANPNPAPQQQVRMGDIVFNLPDFLGSGLVATTPATTTATADDTPVFEPTRPQVLAASDDALTRRKRSLRKRQIQLTLHLCPGTLQACGLPSGSYECRGSTSPLLQSVPLISELTQMADSLAFSHWVVTTLVDTSGELNSCGACIKEGGIDCEAIPNVENVSCAVGRCEVRK